MVGSNVINNPLISITPSASLSSSDILNMSILAEKNQMNGIWIGETLGRAAVPILSAISQKTTNLLLYSGILNVFSITPMKAERKPFNNKSQRA